MYVQRGLAEYNYNLKVFLHGMYVLYARLKTRLLHNKETCVSFIDSKYFYKVGRDYIIASEPNGTSGVDGRCIYYEVWCEASI